LLLFPPPVPGDPPLPEVPDPEFPQAASVKLARTTKPRASRESVMTLLSHNGTSQLFTFHEADLSYPAVAICGADRTQARR
jgi:hypothetical protein